MDYERIRDFILSYSKDRNDILESLRESAEDRNVPIIRRDMESFLGTLIAMNRPGRILEIGTAIGYSAIVMAGAGGCHIDTCELSEDRVQEAHDNIVRAGYVCDIRTVYGNVAVRDEQSDSVNVKSDVIIYQGDAAQTIKEFNDKYDFIFIDAAKAQYMIYLKECIRLSHPGTVIVTDNIFEDGKVLQSHFLVEKRDRTIHDRMREYLEYITNTEELETAILSIGDGVAVSVVK